MLEIHLLDCGALGHRHHVEGGQQAERTDEDSRACCWLAVGYPGGGCRQHQKQLQPQSDADPWNDAGGCSFHQTLQYSWARLKPLLPGHFISCLPAAAGHSDVSAQNCTMQTEYSVHHFVFWCIFPEMSSQQMVSSAVRSHWAEGLVSCHFLYRYTPSVPFCLLNK